MTAKHPIIETLTYVGLLSIHSWGEADDILFVSSVTDPLAEELQDRISGKSVTVRYWITDQECSREDAHEQFLRRLFGSAEVVCESHYSEITGYLWTDEELTIGGHNLMAELHGQVGKWLILEIDVH